MLSALSVDCLTLIGTFIEAQDIAALWLSGDVLFRRNLSHSVTKLDVELSPLRPICWPRFVASLTQLKTLRVSHFKDDTHGVDMLLPIFGFAWSVVPKTLVSFSVALKDSAFVIDSELSLLEKLRIECTVSSRISLLDFARWTPNLKTLSWRELIAGSKFPSLDLSLLPSGLTDLLGSFDKVDMHGATWPPSLVSLCLEVDFDDLWFSQLPSTITDLSLNQAPLGPPNLAHLPNLKYIDMDMPLSALSKLPEGILSLARIPLDHDGLISFPPHLTSLELSNTSLLLTENMAASLPRSLNSIFGPKLQFAPKDVSKIVSLLPPDLEYDCLLDLLFEPAQTLDSSLKTHKQMTSLTLLSREPPDLSNLPPTLCHLDCPMLSPQNILQLPPSLKSIQRFAFNRFSMLNFSELPRQLTRLSGLYTRHAPALPTSSDLPPTLTDLYIPRCTINDESWFYRLPETLTKLELGLTEETSRGIFQAKFPSNLTSLTIDFPEREPHGTYLSVLGCLPQRLIFLNMSSGFDISQEQNDVTGLLDEHMALLPRGLLSITIPASALLTSACVMYLPTNLIRFACGKDENALKSWRSERELCRQFTR